MWDRDVRCEVSVDENKIKDKNMSDLTEYSHLMTCLRHPRLLLLPTSITELSNWWSKLFEPVKFFRHHLPIVWSNSRVVAVLTPSFRPLSWAGRFPKSASKARLVPGEERQSVTSTWGTAGLDGQDRPAGPSPGAAGKIQNLNVTIVLTFQDCREMRWHCFNESECACKLLRKVNVVQTSKQWYS